MPADALAISADVSGVNSLPPESSPTESKRAESSRIEHIRVRRDFLAANSGVRVVTPAFILLVKETPLGHSRVGFTVSRKVGNSVARNRARRRLREVARAIMADAIPSADHVFIARSQSKETPFETLLSDLQGALVKAARKLAPRQRDSVP